MTLAATAFPPAATAAPTQGLGSDAEQLRDELKSKVDVFIARFAALQSATAQTYAAHNAEMEAKAARLGFANPGAQLSANSEKKMMRVMTALQAGWNKIKTDLDDEQSQMGRKLLEVSTATSHEGKAKARRELMSLYEDATNAMRADLARRYAQRHAPPSV